VSAVPSFIFQTMPRATSCVSGRSTFVLPLHPDSIDRMQHIDSLDNGQYNNAYTMALCYDDSPFVTSPRVHIATSTNIHVSRNSQAKWVQTSLPRAGALPDLLQPLYQVAPALQFGLRPPCTTSSDSNPYTTPRLTRRRCPPPGAATASSSKALSARTAHPDQLILDGLQDSSDP
jgi:hypothetical protein